MAVPTHPLDRWHNSYDDAGDPVTDGYVPTAQGDGTIEWEAAPPPSGAAGGDLSGTYPNPSVVNDSHSHTGATVTGISGVPTGILLESDHATPFAFDEILQASDGSDFLWESE